MRVVRLCIDIEAVIAILLDDVADRIGILDDGCTTCSLAFRSLSSAPAPVLVRPAFPFLEGCLFSFGRIRCDTSSHIEDKEANHCLQSLLLLCSTKVFQLSFGRILPSTPEGDKVYRVRESHQRALHIRTDTRPSTIVREGDLVIGILIVAESLVVGFIVAGLGEVNRMLNLHIRPLAARSQRGQSQSRYREDILNLHFLIR